MLNVHHAVLNAFTNVVITNADVLAPFVMHWILA
jgi:hypothetical protein